MDATARSEVRDLFQATADLSPTQRLVLFAYAAADPDESGAIRSTSANLAALAGINHQQFSRVRKGLIRDGYLDEVKALRIGRVGFYRLSAKALGRDTGTGTDDEAAQQAA